MGTHKAVDLAAGALSALRLQSQESSTGSVMAGDRTMIEDDGAEAAAWVAAEQALTARLLGGVRALNDFTAERFAVTQRTEAVLAAAKAFDFRTDNLFLHGPTGSGKSHLAAIAARRILSSRNWQGALETIKPMELSRRLRACDGSAQEEEVLERLIALPVLVIDDLGVAKDTEFLLSAVYEVIDGRYQASRGGLIITSNLSLGEIAQKFGDDRVSSRLAQVAKVFNLTGVRDHRIPEKKS